MIPVVSWFQTYVQRKPRASGDDPNCSYITYLNRA